MGLFDFFRAKKDLTGLRVLIYGADACGPGIKASMPIIRSYCMNNGLTNVDLEKVIHDSNSVPGIDVPDNFNRKKFVIELLELIKSTEGLNEVTESLYNGVAKYTLHLEPEELKGILQD